MEVAFRRVLIGLQRRPFKPMACCLTPVCLPPQATDADKAEVARRERERLRLQEKQKREQLEKLRDSQNTQAATGEVSPVQRYSSHSCHHSV